MDTRKASFIIILLTLFMPHVVAQSTVQNVYGNVYNSDDTPLVGIEVIAWIKGENKGTSITHDYGEKYVSYFNLDVQGLVNDSGENVTFTINGIDALESLLFTPQATQSLDLHAATYINPATIPTTTTSSTTSTTTIPQTTSSTVPTTTTSPQTSSSTTSTVFVSTTTVSATTVTQTTTVIYTTTSTIPVSTTTINTSTTQPFTTSTVKVAAATSLTKDTTQTESNASHTQANKKSLGTYAPYIIATLIIILIIFMVVVIIIVVIKHHV